MDWCRRMLIGVALVGPAIGAHADTPLPPEDQKRIQQGKALTEAAGQQELPSDMQQGIQRAECLKATARRTAEQSRRWAEQWVQRLKQAQAVRQAHLERKKAEREAAAKAPRALVFASRSLGQKGLDDLLSAAAASRNTTVVFRGIPKDATLSRGIWAIQALAAAHKPVPNILIDPTLFRRFSVTAVPAIVLLEAGEAFPIQSEKIVKGAEVLARVAGLSDPAWLLREVAHGVRGDQGIRGPMQAISEPDLLEVMKARMATIDWKTKKKQAKARFWRQQRFIELPRATQYRRRVIDPTVAVAQDIRAADGTVIVQQGERINPLDMRPFTQAVVVFDPLDKRQMVWLAKTIPHLKKRPGVQRLTFIATRLERERGWESYRRVTDAVDAPVYLLTPDVVQRFQVETTPTIITARNKRFVVETFALQSNKPISETE